MAEKEISPNQEKIQQRTEILSTGMRDLQKDRDEVLVPRELKTWMEKVESESTDLSQPSDNNDDSVLQPVATAVTKITLPSDKKTFIAGFGKPVDNAWRWLSEFLLKIIKKNEGNVKFKEE